MASFDLSTHLDNIYASFPEAKQKPIIGITANFQEGMATMTQAYYQQVVDAGGTPVLIPPVADKDVIINTLEGIDGLLLSGGADINPLWTGEEPRQELHHINARRDLPELLITQLAYNRQIPILGICRGIQTLAVALGGKVMQDIESVMAEQEQAEAENADKKKKNKEKEPVVTRQRVVKHTQDCERNQPTHSVDIDKDSIIYRIYKSERIYVNSFHHQAVADPGTKFRITAKAPDGVTEAIESKEFKPILGVQWHPGGRREKTLRVARGAGQQLQVGQAPA